MIWLSESDKVLKKEIDFKYLGSESALKILSGIPRDELLRRALYAPDCLGRHAYNVLEWRIRKMRPGAVRPGRAGIHIFHPVFVIHSV